MNKLKLTTKVVNILSFILVALSLFYYAVPEDTSAFAIFFRDNGRLILAIIIVIYGIYLYYESKNGPFSETIIINASGFAWIGSLLHMIFVHFSVGSITMFATCSIIIWHEMLVMDQNAKRKKTMKGPTVEDMFEALRREQEVAEVKKILTETQASNEQRKRRSNKQSAQSNNQQNKL